MDIKVLYIGSDVGYWSKLKKKFQSDYAETNFEFIDISDEDKSAPYFYFIEIYQKMPQIVYLDFSNDFEMSLKLAKLLTRNNETRLMALVGLFSTRQDFKCLQRTINASVRLLHKKSDEFLDVTYDPISLIDVNLAEMPEYAKGKGIKDFTVFQTLRIGYIESNLFHVETNSKLNENEIVEVDEHPLMGIMPSRRVFVQKFYQRDLYYNRRFSYDLEFIYIDNDYFAATNENWKLYKRLKEDSDFFETLNPHKKEEVLSDIEERKKVYSPIKQKIDEWIEEKSHESKPKQLKTMIIDDSLTLMKEIKENNFNFPYALNFQTVLTGKCFQITRSMPHLIVIKESEKNNSEMISHILDTVKAIDDYNPYVIICDTKITSEQIREKKSYDHVICYQQTVTVRDLSQMAAKVEPSLPIVPKDRIFIRSESDSSTMYLKRNFTVVTFSESVLYLKTDLEIPMWTVFIVKQPVEMLLTVVPHKENSELSGEENVFRCLINGVGEIEKSQIRQLINKSLAQERDEEGQHP